MLNGLRVTSTAVDWSDANRIKQLIWYADLMSAGEEEKACA